MKVLVLGAGRVGSAMVVDLAQDTRFQVTAADRDAKRLLYLKEKCDIQTIQADLSNPGQLKKMVSDFDLVMDAVPGFIGYQTFKTVIEAGKHVVDIAFFPEDPFTLNKLAKEKGVIAIMDCGVAPGMSNILIGYVDHLLDETESVHIYVGGLPIVRQWPYEYKAVFSPLDVIEEYTRPARFVENGRVVTRPALTDLERVDFEGVGTLEAFNTDGLRTLIQTIPAPNMKEKTLRYPGHAEKMAVLRETGFFSQEPIKVNGISVRPIDVTASLLFPMWELKPDEEDITIMRVVVEGRRENKRLRYTYDLFDRFDRKTQTTSMSRTTGYTATAVVRLLAEGLYDRFGISPPEYLGKKPECVQFILERLKERGIIYKESIIEIS